MTTFDVLTKLVFANFRRYKLYFFCNVFSIVLFYCFAAIFTNKSFMDENKVNSMISSNIIAPSVFVGVFLVLFIPYSFHAFMKNRKHEYGIFMTLGMSQGEVLVNMLVENGIIAILSLLCGLILGTGISFLFYFMIRQLIGISALQWTFNVSSYLWTTLVYGAAVLVTLVTGVFGLIKAQITDLIKEKFRAQKHFKESPVLFIAGLLLIITAILIMSLYSTSVKWFVGLAVLLIGFWLATANVESIVPYLIKIFFNGQKKHILEHSFIRQNAGSQNRIRIIAAGMIGFSFWFTGLCGVIYPLSTHNAICYSPYDLVYSQIFGKNQAEGSDIENILNQNGVTVTSLKQLDYLRTMAYTLLPVSEVNTRLNCNYQLSAGEFLTIFQYDRNDGYEHDMIPSQTVGFTCGKDLLKLQSAGSDVKILFNGNPTFADTTLILNDADYSKIASQCGNVWKGVTKLYTFDGWRNSGKGIAAVQKYLFDHNKIAPTEEKYYAVSSKIETYVTNTQSAEFFIFLMTFLVLLFCVAADMVIHFKIQSESEEEKRMLSGLYRIGLTNDEMLELIQYKNKVTFMPPVLIGLLIGVIAGYTMNQSYGYGWLAAGCSLFIGILLIIIQYVCMLNYTKNEFQRLSI